MTNALQQMRNEIDLSKKTSLLFIATKKKQAKD
jgi:hypothetical protein